jgi:hypothetical protein
LPGRTEAAGEDAANNNQGKAMNKRPRSVTFISWVFIATGVIGFSYHISKFNVHDAFGHDGILVCVVRLLAIVGGAFMLLGWNWARWLSILWMTAHTILSVFHQLSELIMHSVLLAVFVLFLFRPQASEFFRRARAERAQSKN